MKVLGILAFGLLLVVCVGLAAEERVGQIPKEIQQAEKTLTKWTDGFRDQTPDQVRNLSALPPRKPPGFMKRRRSRC